MRSTDTGLRAKLTQFFADNPDEELTYALLVAKYDVRTDTAREVVRELSRAGVIESVHVIRARSKGIAK